MPLKQISSLSDTANTRACRIEVYLNKEVIPKIYLNNTSRIHLKYNGPLHNLHKDTQICNVAFYDVIRRYIL